MVTVLVIAATLGWRNHQPAMANSISLDAASTATCENETASDANASHSDLCCLVRLDTVTVSPVSQALITPVVMSPPIVNNLSNIICADWQLLATARSDLLQKNLQTIIKRE